VSRFDNGLFNLFDTDVARPMHDCCSHDYFLTK
jgi:hypothetical protein